MNKVRSPKIGYSSEAKQSYREQVWDSIVGQVGDSGVMLILPSKEGEEIDYLVSRGFPQSRIICIDENPALIASAPWRKKYKSIKAWGCKVSQVGGRLRKAGISISGANIDLCNNFSEELVTEVASFLATAPITPKFCFSVTVSKGRESSAVNYLMNMLMKSGSWETSDYNKLSEKRIACLMRIASQHIQNPSIIKLAGEGSYTHHKTPMAWAAFSVLNINDSGCINELYEKAGFERRLCNSSKFDYSGLTLVSCSDYDSWGNIVENCTLKDIKRDFKVLYGFIERVLRGDEVNAYMYARLSLKEHDEIVSQYESIVDGAIDYDKRCCPISSRLEQAGVSYRMTESLRYDVGLYEKIKNKLG